tara:strand:- start:126 stop:326 length:201 start_codon:yes stop_codon:yes gene_type:complete
MGYEVTGPLGLLVLVLNVYAILQTARSNAPGIVRALWVVLIIVLPFVGFIAWILLGPRETHSLFRR